MYALVQLHLINDTLLELLTVNYTKANDNFLCTFAIAYLSSLQTDIVTFRAAIAPRNAKYDNRMFWYHKLQQQ